MPIRSSAINPSTKHSCYTLVISITWSVAPTLSTESLLQPIITWTVEDSENIIDSEYIIYLQSSYIFRMQRIVFFIHICCKTSKAKQYISSEVL